MSTPNPTTEPIPFRSPPKSLEQLTAENEALLTSVQFLSTSVTALTDRVTMLERLMPAFQVEG